MISTLPRLRGTILKETREDRLQSERAFTRRCRRHSTCGCSDSVQRARNGHTLPRRHQMSHLLTISARGCCDRTSHMNSSPCTVCYERGPDDGIPASKEQGSSVSRVPERNGSRHSAPALQPFCITMPRGSPPILVPSLTDGITVACGSGQLFTLAFTCKESARERARGRAELSLLCKH